MLKQRIITAIVLLAILLPAVFHPAVQVFGLVTVALIAAGAWEWSKLNRGGSLASIGAAVVCAGMCIASWYFGLITAAPKVIWIVIGGGWVVLGAWLLHGGVAAWTNVHPVLRWCGGIVALWAAWLAVVQARIIGINFLFSVLVLVWVADIGAYFAGRAFGGRIFARKLAPTISPGKTWEGVCGGVVGVLVCAFVWQAWDAGGSASQASLYTRLGSHGIAFMVFVVLFLAMMSVVGDLLESLFKRSAGVKDSSNLLPGHGGVLDRVDALLPILPLAMALATL